MGLCENPSDQAVHPARHDLNQLKRRIEKRIEEHRKGGPYFEEYLIQGEIHALEWVLGEIDKIL